MPHQLEALELGRGKAKMARGRLLEQDGSSAKTLRYHHVPLESLV